MNQDHDFTKNTVAELKTYLKERGIPVSQCGRLKRKKDLADLCVKATKLEVEKQSEYEDRRENLKTAALTTPDGVLSLNVGWTYDFSGLKFCFADLFVYLVGKEDYNVDNLKSFKSLTGYKLAACGNVQELKRSSTILHNNYVLISFKVKPTQKSLVKDEGATMDSYPGFVVIKKCGTVQNAFCICKGASDGACRHVAAALFDLEFTLSNTAVSCSSVKCMWTPRSATKPSKEIEVKNMEIKKLEYGKESQKAITATKLETPILQHPNNELQLQLAEGLRKCYPHSVWLQYAPIPEPVLVDDLSLLATISNDALIDHEEVAEYVEVYSMEECAEAYKSNHPVPSEVTTDVCEDFLQFMSSLYGEEQASAICAKTQYQSHCSFWYQQRKARLTASFFYRICHLKPTTNPILILADIFQYKPIIQTVATEWGKQRESVAADQYQSKLMSKHRNLVLQTPGLYISHSAPFLGATPDRIRSCDCCKSCLVEIKCKYAKKNLLPHVAASDMLFKSESGNLQVKEETSWNYQCQGQMAITGVHSCDLVIYTLKGICTVCIKYDPQKWKIIQEKLLLFFKKHVIPELLTAGSLDMFNPEP